MRVTLDHAPSQIVQRVLIALGLGTLPSAGVAWPVYYENEPDRPDDAVTVQETVGRQEPRDMLDGGQDRTYGFQILVRGANRARARLKADSISATVARRDLCYFDQPACWVTLDAEATGTGESSYVLQTFVRIGNPIPIGADLPGGKRQKFTINCEARIVQQA